MDASGVGIGGTLLQNDQPVAFYSNTLTETEQRYAVIEKECLALCLAFEKWDSLLYGKSDITVETDHQPLESIFKKPLNKAPRRLQAMRMRLQRWSFVVKYKKGAQQVIADTLSRAPLPQLSKANLSGEQIFRVELEAMALDNSGISKVTQENLQEQTSSCTEPYNHNKGLSMYRDQLSSWKMDQQTMKQRTPQHHNINILVEHCRELFSS